MGKRFSITPTTHGETFFQFIAENPGATFHHAITSDGINIVYCRDKDKGMWFLPGSGMGPLQATGHKIMKETPIEAQAFRDRANAAVWLDVAAEFLKLEDKPRSPH